MYVAETKALISFGATAKLICVFVFAYAKRWFSHDAAQMFVIVHIKYLGKRILFTLFGYANRPSQYIIDMST